MSHSMHKYRVTQKYGNNASPIQPDLFMRLHMLSPDTQGGWHQDGHPEPAAADNEGHEKAEVMHGWDLSVS